jgi:D-beta-D-heptose 7-phosphate kinase/D-beta-D-heptose 1-phosphate adenosyltransferase
MRHFDFSACRILVVGDLMLDRYLTGSVGRLSPEAPVPVLLRQAERAVLGGAGNVVANIASLGADVRPIGVVGPDDPGRQVTAMLASLARAGTDGLVQDAGRPTTCKTRVMSGFHQFVRLDAESSAPLERSVEDAVVAAFEHALDWADVIVLSDYAKGVCTDRVIRAVIEGAARVSKPTIIDPKRRDFSVYRGATLLKPNRRELTEATKLPCVTDSQAHEAARAAIAQTGSAILLTRSEQGMSYFTDGQAPRHLKTAAQDVFDVSGAGDTVIALAALGLAAKLPVEELMRVANAAAGVVVSKVGTAAVTIGELDDALEADAHTATPNKGAFFSLAEATQRREEWRTRGLRVGFTNGCFDLLHPGHVSLLKQAAEKCDRLIVAINSDASVKRLKGPTRPIQDQGSRAYVLGALSAVDLVIVFEDDTPAEVIKALQPDLLVKGADYTEDQVVGADVVKAAGGEVLLVPVVNGQSTTSMIGRMAPN